MAKSKAAKETSLPVIVWAVFMTVLAIGLGVFTYVLYSDQEAKDAAVTKAGADLKIAREAAKDAELIARVHRVFSGLGEGSGDQSDLVIVQNEVKEGAKPYQELQKLNAAAKKRGTASAKEFEDKFNAANPTAKMDVSSLIKEDDFNVWPGDLDDKKQIKAPTSNMIDVAVRSRIFRDLALKQTVEEKSSYDGAVATVTKSKGDYDKAATRFNTEANNFPPSLAAKVKEVEKALDAARDTYRKNENASRLEIRKKEDIIDDMKREKGKLELDIKGLNETVLALKANTKSTDPFQYDEPQGKITKRLADNIVEIDIGSNSRVQAGLTFTVLPLDFPQKGRQSRMKIVRLPDDRGNYKPVELFIPKATIEVIEVLGPNLARARITTEENDIRDAAMTGDLLYNSAWRKGQADHIALVGIFDLNGDGTDDIDILVRDLTKMGIPVDAYLDLKTQKWVGKLTDRTRFVIDGFTPIPTANDANLDLKTKLIGSMKTAKDEAVKRNIPVVAFRDFFGRIGYKAKIDVSEDRINQAAARYLSGVGTIETPPPPN